MSDFQESVFGNHDVVVVVDDWKSSQSSAVDSPIYFLGRLFSIRDKAFADLYSVLSEAGAANWHASGNRSSFEFLFTAASFSEVVELLQRMDSGLFDMLASATSFESPAVRAQWDRICLDNPHIAAVWNPAPAQALGFFRYVELLAGDLEHFLPTGTRVRVVVDTLDWFAPRRRPVEIVDGIASLGSGSRSIHMEVLALVDKSGAAAKAFLPLLGLVDSEAWAFGRMQSLKLPTGMTIRQRSLEWRSTGADPTQSLFSEAALRDALAPHADHANLQSYWELWGRWVASRRAICLVEKPAAIARRATRLAR